MAGRTSQTGHPMARRRVMLDLTQDDVARLMGLTPGAIGQWESSRTTPSPAHLWQLADILDVSADTLRDWFPGTGRPPTRQTAWYAYAPPDRGMLEAQVA